MKNMRKRGKKLLAIMLAASMTLGQSGTLTAAQENAAEIIESVTFNAQSEDGISDDLEGEESEEDGDTEQGDNEDENPFTTSDEETDPAPENNQNNTVPDNFQNQTAETLLTFEQVKEELEAGTSITPVKTGDNTPVIVMILLLAASALIIATVTVRTRKHK